MYPRFAALYGFAKSSLYSSTRRAFSATGSSAFWITHILTIITAPSAPITAITAVGNAISEHYAAEHKAHNKEFDEWVEGVKEEYQKLDRAISATFNMFKRDK